MELSEQRIALYGRMQTCSRAGIAARIEEAGGVVERGLTRRTTLLVIGRGSMNLIPSGHLAKHLAAADAQSTPIVGEKRLADFLNATEPPPPTFPLSRVTPAIPAGLAAILNAFDIVYATADDCRFQDVETFRGAISLLDDGHEMSSVVRTLLQADAAPAGRYQIVTDPSGDVRLDWGDVLTGLDGQGLLPLPEHPDLDDLFDAALLAEAEGRLDQASRAYALCAQMDRRDPIAPFNLANVLARLGQDAEAATRHGQAIARDPRFAEAYFNRAGLAEARRDIKGAVTDLEKAIDLDPSYSEAFFNLAQLKLKQEKPDEAARLIGRVLELEPTAEQRAIAKKLLIIARRRSNASPEG